MIRCLEHWADRNFTKVMFFLMGTCAGAILIFVLQGLGGVVCPEVSVGTMP